MYRFRFPLSRFRRDVIRNLANILYLELGSAKLIEVFPKWTIDGGDRLKYDVVEIVL